MKKTFLKIQSVDGLIRECEKEIAAIKHLPYYRIFRQEAQQRADIYAVQIRLDELLEEKKSLLEELKQQVINWQSKVAAYQV